MGVGLALSLVTATIGGALLLTDRAVNGTPKNPAATSPDAPSPSIEQSKKASAADTPEVSRSLAAAQNLLAAPPVPDRSTKPVKNAAASHGSESVVTPVRKDHSQMIQEQYQRLATKPGWDSSFYKSQRAEVQPDGRIKMNFKSAEDMEKFFTALAKTGVQFTVRDAAGKELFKSDKKELIVCGKEPVSANAAKPAASKSVPDVPVAPEREPTTLAP